MDKSSTGFEADAYTGLATVGRIQIIIGGIIVSVITIIIIMGGLESMNPFLILGGLLFGGFCYWLYTTMYKSKALSAMNGSFLFLRLL